MDADGIIGGHAVVIIPGFGLIDAVRNALDHLTAAPLAFPVDRGDGGFDNLGAAGPTRVVTIAGVAGSVVVAPPECSNAGQQVCVASGSYYAGTTCAANAVRHGGGLAIH
jgi:hypothetical protein